MGDQNKKQHQQDEDDDYLAITSPFDLDHPVHVDFSTETGFKGLPSEWEALMKTNGLTRDDVQKDSGAVLAVLEFHDHFNEMEGKKPEK